MSTNQTNISLTKSISLESYIVAYYALTLMIGGTLFNLLTLIILSRASFRDTKNRPTLHYMRAIAIFDILMLFGWNLDHYLVIIHEFYILKYSLVTCKLICFISYVAPQTSAWLRVFVSLDRYLSLSRRSRTCFNQSRTILIVIICVIVIFILLNLHILIFGCYYRKANIISAQARSYRIYPMWDYVNLGVYNCLPFICLVILNSGVIYHLIDLRRTTMIQNSRIRHRPITLTLVITTFLFLFMTIPATVAYAFFPKSNLTLLHFLDGILYTYHVLSFPLYFITFREFREQCIAMMTCRKNQTQIHPQYNTPMGT